MNSAVEWEYRLPVSDADFSVEMLMGNVVYISGIYAVESVLKGYVCLIDNLSYGSYYNLKPLATHAVLFIYIDCALMIMCSFR